MAFEKVASLSELDSEEALAIEGEPKIVLYRVEDEVFASQFFCTHAEAPMDDGWVSDDCTVECPWHAAKFDLRTGKALCAPASVALTMYAVKVDAGEIWVDRTAPSEGTGT